MVRSCLLNNVAERTRSATFVIASDIAMNSWRLLPANVE